MKKTIRTITLTLAAAAASTVLAFSSGENTVISLSYLNGTFASQLAASLRSSLNVLDHAYEAAIDRLEAQTGQNLSGSGWTSTSSFQTFYPLAGETVTLAAGSGLMWYSGSATTSVALVDVTAGSELPAGASLTAGHRYLAETEAVITASASSSCAAEGLWRTTATGTAPVQSPFRDVANSDWFFDPVMYVVERGLFQGTSGTTFEPMSTMSRSMLVTVLYRRAGQPAVTGTNPFSDVPAGTWYTDAVIWAAQTGIVTGAGDGTFAPDDQITREQIAVMLHRYCAYFGHDAAARADVTTFRDHDSISSFASDSVSWAVAIGLLQGSDSRLSPTNSATRCEVATMLQRFDQWLV